MAHELTKKEWAALRRSIKRHKEEFINVRHENGRFTLVSTFEFRGSEPLPFETAKQFLKDAIDKSVSEGKGKPFYTSSKLWAMEREKEESEYKRVGRLTLPPRMIERVCVDELGKDRYKRIVLEDKSMLVGGYIDYVCEDTANDPFVKKLMAREYLSESYIVSMEDSDNFGPADSGMRGLPRNIDELWPYLMDPTG